MVIKIEYDNWKEAQFLVNNIKNQAEFEGIEVSVKPSSNFVMAKEEKKNEQEAREGRQAKDKAS